MLVLLEDGENTGRGRVPLLAGGAGRQPDTNAAAVDVDELVWKRDNDRYGAAWGLLRVLKELTWLQIGDFASGNRDGLEGEKARRRRCGSSFE